MPSPDFQVVILAGGECKRLYPLTSAGTASCQAQAIAAVVYCLGGLPWHA
jgi:hypothetical protein